jgi:hypothetical protein
LSDTPAVTQREIGKATWTGGIGVGRRQRVVANETTIGRVVYVKRKGDPLPMHRMVPYSTNSSTTRQVMDRLHIRGV